MDYEIWIKSLSQAKGSSTKNELIVQLISHLEKTGMFLCGEIKSFFTKLNKEFSVLDDEILPLFLKLIETLIRHAGHDIEFYIEELLLNVI